MNARPTFTAVVMAGERPGGSALSRALNVPAGVLVPVAGRPALLRVLAALRSSRGIEPGLVCGPAPAVLAATPGLEAAIAEHGFRWLVPAAGPAASAMAAMAKLDRWPLLVTTGDHALLTPAMIEDFCAQAALARADAVVGLVPYPRVAAAYPESRRTRLRFADGERCGSNLFAFRGPRALAAAAFWQRVEADRKRPWRIARRLGLPLLLRYLLGRCSLADALATLSRRAGCTIGAVELDFPDAAVDVDSVEDWRLAERILTERAPEADRSGTNPGRPPLVTRLKQ